MAAGHLAATRDNIAAIVDTRRHHAVLLGLIIAIHLMNGAAVIALDNQFDIPDAADHFVWSRVIADALKHGDVAKACRILWSGDRPPLGIIPTTLVLAVAPRPGIVLARLSVLPWLALLMLATYWIGRRLHSPVAGLFGAAAVAAMPQVMGFSRLTWLDVPLGAGTALALLALLATDGFQRTRASLVFGAAAGAGLLTKQAFPIFILPPALGVLVVGLRKSGRKWRAIGNAALAAVIAGSIFASWLIPRAAGYLSFLKQSMSDNPSDPIQPGLVQTPVASRFAGYLGHLPNVLLGPALFLLYIGAVVVLVRRDRRRIVGVCTLWLWGSLVILAWFVVWPRYVIPALPAAAVVIGAGLAETGWPQRSRGRALLVLGLLLLLPLQQSWFGPQWVWCADSHPTARGFCAGLIRPVRRKIQRPDLGQLLGQLRGRSVFMVVLPQRLHRAGAPSEPARPPFRYLPEAFRFWLAEDGIYSEVYSEVYLREGHILKKIPYVVLVEESADLRFDPMSRRLIDHVRREVADRRVWRQVVATRLDGGPRLSIFENTSMVPDGPSR